MRTLLWLDTSFKVVLFK